MGRINVTSSIFEELLSSNSILMAAAELRNDCCLKQNILVEGALGWSLHIISHQV